MLCTTTSSPFNSETMFCYLKTLPEFKLVHSHQFFPPEFFSGTFYKSLFIWMFQIDTILIFIFVSSCPSGTSMLIGHHKLILVTDLGDCEKMWRAISRAPSPCQGIHFLGLLEQLPPCSPASNQYSVFAISSKGRNEYCHRVPAMSGTHYGQHSLQDVFRIKIWFLETCPPSCLLRRASVLSWGISVPVLHPPCDVVPLHVANVRPVTPSLNSALSFQFHKNSSRIVLLPFFRTNKYFFKIPLMT